MSPAAHAAVGAALAGRIPRLSLAIPAAFLSHFLMDSVYHFEAFYALARWMGVSRAEAFLTAAAVLGGALAPAMLWIARKDRRLFLFLIFAGALSVALTIPRWEVKAALTGVLVAAYLTLAWSRRALIWTVGALAAVCPDILKFASTWFYEVHGWWHYSAVRDMGYWMNRWLGGPQLYIWDRFTSVGYVAGYGLEALFESAFLLGGLWLMAKQAEAERSRRAAESVPSSRGSGVASETP